MTDYNAFGIPARFIKFFKNQQQKYFSLKADIPVSKVSPDMKIIEKIIHRELGKNIVSVYQYPRSTLHWVFRIKTKNKSFILRVNAYSENYHELQFYIERWASEQLARRSLAFAQVFSIDTSRKTVPYDYQILEYLDGTSLFISAKEGSPPFVLFEKLGSFIAKIHSIKTKDFGPFSITSIINNDKGVGIYQSWRMYLTRNMKRHLQLCQKNDVLTKKQADDIFELLSSMKDIKNCNPVLLHGDIANHNVFLNKGRIIGLIDWEDMLSGDRLYDIAYYHTGCFMNEDWFTAFLKGYKNITQKDVKSELYWLYYLRIAIAKTVIRLRYKQNEAEKLPNLSQRIQFGLEQTRKYR